LARIRLKEAGTLLEARYYDGAYYLCGYAAECALKACIAKATRRSEFPDKKRVNASYTHDLACLVAAAGLLPDLQTEAANDPDFYSNWSVAKDWSEEARYSLHDGKKAQDMFRALAHRQHGVMRWIRKHW
jgi:hypothetical protein